MIERTTDLARVNRLLQRDFPEADFSEILAEPLHIILVEGESGALFAWRGPGIYEVHLFFAARGREAIDLFRRMQGQVKHDLMWALIPLRDRKTRMFARLVGWASHGTVSNRHGPHELFVLKGNRCLQS